MIALIPPLLAIILAIATRRLIPSLLAALWVGSFLVAPGLLSSITSMAEYITKILLDAGKLQPLLFLYVFSGFIGLLKFSGGIHAFSKALSKRIKSKRGALLWIWALFPITFLDCGFRVVAAGSIMGSVVQKFKISKPRFASILNTSASPPSVLIPVATTFVGYMVGVIQSGLDVAGSKTSAFVLFVKSIPLNFFSYAIIGVMLVSILTGWQFAKRPVKKKKEMKMDCACDRCPENKSEYGKALKPHIFNIILPIGLLIFLSFYLMWLDGGGGSLFTAFPQADAPKVMFLAILITTIFTGILLKLQSLPMKGMVEQFIEGGNKLMPTIIILLLAWPIALVSKDLGLANLVVTFFSGTIPPFFIPVLVFLVASFVAYAIGSSWGTWALLMPVAIPLAASSEISLPLVIGAVFSGGTFGDVTSPVSGMAVMSSGIAGTNAADYAREQILYSMTALVLASLAFLLFGFL